MTIRSNDVYRQYAPGQDPATLFGKVAGWVSVIQDSMITPEQQEIIAKEVNDAMVRAIFGSNMIERAGLGWDITMHLCHKIFSGEAVGEITETDPAYQDALLEIHRKQPELKNMPPHHILRGRNEIVQHAKAYQHIINSFVIQKRDLTEDLIKETHRILAIGVPVIQAGHANVLPEEYGGIYRKVIVGAGNSNFTVPHFIPSKMEEMCSALKKDLETASMKGFIDPISVATKYSLEFVQIHPFLDGNGRMCRMILNAIICRYMGVIVPIGEQGEERSEYMAIKKRSSAEMEGHGEYATFVLGRAVTRLREMKKKLAGKKK